MNPDISKVLADWPFEPGKLTCRLLDGPDGQQVVQIRLDLGILQMAADGRPDGQTPNGFPSLLDYFEDLLTGREPDAEAAAGDPPTTPSEDAKEHLSREDCRALRDEAEQFYRRYIALMVLEDYERVVRDTTRNLRVIDLCREYAEAEEDRTSLEQFRPYIVMVRTRALASLALKDNEPKAAVVALDDGLESLRKHFAESGQSQMFEKSSEVQALRTMREGLVPKLPVSQKTELRARLDQALKEENYELAAILRDELKQLKD